MSTLAAELDLVDLAGQPLSAARLGMLDLKLTLQTPMLSSRVSTAWRPQDYMPFTDQRNLTVSKRTLIPISTTFVRVGKHIAGENQLMGA